MFLDPRKTSHHPFPIPRSVFVSPPYGFFVSKEKDNPSPQPQTSHQEEAIEKKSLQASAMHSYPKMLNRTCRVGSPLYGS